jgi:putative flavoprotein involved in K+ transport
VLLHASDYRRPEPYLDADVLVVGTGNTGTEIAAELVERGARRVRLAVRTPPHVVPRTLAGLPTTLLGITNGYTPRRIGDPSPHGLPTPANG